jgi:hypothetical protein
MLQRARDLIAIEIDGKRPTLVDRFDGVKAKHAAAGALRSGATLKALHSASRDELEERTQVIFKAFQRVHTAFMPGAGNISRDEAKAFAHLSVERETAEISALLAAELRRITDERTVASAGLTLDKEFSRAIRKADIEIDLYFDQLDSSGQI